MDLTKDLKFPRFFIQSVPGVGGKSVITGGDAKHISLALRMREGERVVLCCGDGFDYPSEIVLINKNSVELTVLARRKNDSEPKTCLRLFQCVPKGEKLDFIVQKATELGVSEIIPVISRRCISRPGKSEKQDKNNTKIKRLQKISEAAAKQSGRGKIPIIHEFTNFNDALKLYKKENTGIIFYENGGKRINDILSAETKLEAVPQKTSDRSEALPIDIFIGSEGGFEFAEIEAAKEAGLIPASLGKLILRTETAPITAISILMNLTGEL
ncbi:MAG: 16S rRNA (uracil(1498)-N(3))-methyltransferase [Oscillospiraceae bacterium]|nr:16S rRNA (uracil(1498)-N(3))-methyltransferase [Oscillospiraceae bacterium]